MERMKTARNVAIVLALAAAVDLLPGGGRAAETFTSALWVAFAAGIAFVAVRLYREHRIALHSLGHQHRALLYGGVATGLFAWMAKARMWQASLGELAWFVLVLGVAYALLEVFRHARSY